MGLSEIRGLAGIASGNRLIARHMGAIICLINQKGGCGKSSTTFHLAGAFANQGNSVLLVDADPQGSLSQGFLGPEHIESLQITETVTGAFDGSFDFCAHTQAIHRTEIPGISIVPANHNLTEFNVPHPERLGMQQFALAQFLDALPDHDLTLIDCPPNLYGCSWSALLAADYVIIPVPPEDFGAQGLRVVHQAIEQAQRLNPRLKLLGHLVTRLDRRLVVHRTYETRLRSLYSSSVLTTVIPEASAFKVALACRQPVGTFSPRSTAAKLTDQLSREIVDRMQGITREAAVA